MKEITPASDISFLSFWYWSAIFVFFATLLICFFSAVRPTLREENKDDWKLFWNKIEFAWIALACFSAFGALETAWSPVQAAIAEVLEEGAQEEVTQSQVAAVTLKNEYCQKQEADSTFCQVLEEISGFQDHTDFQSLNQYLLILWRNGEALDNDELLQRTYSELEQDWYNATGMSQDAAYERSRQAPLTSIFGRPILFWPHLLLIGVALRLCRARAVFAFS